MKNKIIEIGTIIYDEKDITPSSLGIQNRQLNYWIDKRLIPFVSKVYENEQDRRSDSTTMMKRVRINVSQAVWTCIIDELSNLGQKPRDLFQFGFDVWQKPRNDQYADKVFENHVKKNPLKLSGDLLNIIKDSLEDNLLMEHYYRTLINPFTDMIKSVLLREDYPHTLIYVPRTGEHQFVSRSSEILLNLSNTYLQETFISVPLLPIITKVLGVDMSKRKKSLFYLNNIEQQIVQKILHKNPKKIEIVFEGGKIKPIVVREEHKKPEELAKFFLNNKIKPGTDIEIQKRSQGNYIVTLKTK